MEKLNIYQKIHAIMQDISYLQKDDEVGFGSNKYKAITEEKVTTAVRNSLIKNGVVIIPVEQERNTTPHGETKSGAINLLTETNTKYRIQNIDDKDDYIIAASSGSGVDTQDKGIGKAMTYSYKYLLLRMLGIPTGNDPDKIASYEIDNDLKPAQSKQLLEKAKELNVDLEKLATYMKRNGVEYLTNEDLKFGISKKEVK